MKHGVRGLATCDALARGGQGDLGDALVEGLVAPLEQRLCQSHDAIEIVSDRRRLDMSQRTKYMGNVNESERVPTKLLALVKSSEQRRWRISFWDLETPDSSHSTC